MNHRKFVYKENEYNFLSYMDSVFTVVCITIGYIKLTQIWKVKIFKRLILITLIHVQEYLLFTWVIFLTVEALVRRR